MNLSALLPAGVTPEDLISLGAGASAFLAILAVWLTLVQRSTGTRRVKELAARRDDLRSGILRTRKRAERTVSTSFMRQVVQKFNLQRSARAEAMTQRMAQAGWRTGDALVRYLFFKIASPILFGIAAVIVFHVLEFYSLEPMMRLLATVTAVLLGFYMPDIIVKNTISKRATKLRRSLPDALDLMVICAEAGLSLDQMLKRVSEEFGAASPELADELAITSLELGFLPDRRQALQNLINRTNLPSIRGVVNSLLQSDKFGTPLAQSLRVLSAEYREERMLRAEEKAARLPAMLTVPMIIFILPCLFIVLLGPAILRVMDALSGV